MMNKTNLINQKVVELFILKRIWIAKIFEFMRQSAMSVMSTMRDRQLRLFSKDGALTDITKRTWSIVRQVIELHSNLTMLTNF